MSHLIDANYEQLFLLPPALEDWLPMDDPARFIRTFVDAMDLEKLHLSQQTEGAGRPPYSNSLMLKIWLYCRLHKIMSSRNMEKACYRDIGLIWLTGMNYPDHNSIWRFGKLNDKILKELLRQVVEIATKGGMVGLVLQALDGTKIKADISNGRGCSKTVIKKVLAKLDEIVEELCVPEDDPAGDEEEYRMPEQLSDPAKLSNLVHKLLKATKNAEKLVLDKGIKKEDLKERLGEVLSHDEGINDPVDPDARVMKCDDKKQFGYNAEVVVDEKHGIIVAADVTQENNDRHQLAPMLKEAKDNTGQCAQMTVADGDYLSGSQLAQAEDLGAQVLVHDGETSIEKNNPYHISKFTYKAEVDCYICPLGKELLFRREVPGKDGGMDREYICKQSDCPEFEDCTSSKRGRTILRSAYAEQLTSNREKIAQSENIRLLRLRKTIVEIVFGHIKHNDGYRRWRVRGLSKVTAEWRLIAVTYNLKKIYNLWRIGMFSITPLSSGI